MRHVILVTLMLSGVSPAIAADGRFEINHVSVLEGGITPGDTPGYPATLSVEGSYVLTSNLFIPNHNTHGIVVSAEFVSIDLNGFSIIGTTTCSNVPVDACAPLGTGRGITSDFRGTSVSNGVVRGAGLFGVLLSSDGGTIESVRAQDNGSTGLAVSALSEDAGGAIRNSVSNRNGGDGVFVGNGGLAFGNVAYGNAQYGLHALEGSRVVGNTLRLNFSFGLLCSEGTGFADNVITGNAQGDANPQTNAFCIDMGGNVCGTDTSCP